MDSTLSRRLNALNEQNDKLTKSEAIALELDAQKKVIYSQLLLKLLDPALNMATKEAKVYASQEWQDFINGLVAAESSKNSDKRRYEILNNAFIAELNTYKREGSLIDKGGINP
ncbi:MAG: hypothetical protein V4708_12160 [Bacteroidota bacterium]